MTHTVPTPSSAMVKAPAVVSSARQIFLLPSPLRPGSCPAGGSAPQAKSDVSDLAHPIDLAELGNTRVRRGAGVGVVSEAPAVPPTATPLPQGGREPRVACSS